MPDPPIVNVAYRSTNYWVIGSGGRRLLVDLGWPGTFGTLRANLRRAGVPLEAIRYALATHFHIDHAGLGQELKNAGVPLIVTPEQLAAIPLMKAQTTPRPARDHRAPGADRAHAGSLRRQRFVMPRHRSRIHRGPDAAGPCHR